MRLKAGEKDEVADAQLLDPHGAQNVNKAVVQEEVKQAIGDKIDPMEEQAQEGGHPLLS